MKIKVGACQACNRTPSFSFEEPGLEENLGVCHLGLAEVKASIIVIDIIIVANMTLVIIIIIIIKGVKTYHQVSTEHPAAGEDSYCILPLILRNFEGFIKILRFKSFRNYTGLFYHF